MLLLRATVAAVLLQVVASAVISLSPGSGLPGTSFVVSGRGFVPGDRVRVLWDGSNLGGTTEVDATGTFTYLGTVPSGTSTGAHTVEAKGRDSGSAHAGFEVLAPATTTPSPTTTTASTTTAVPPTSTTSARVTTTNPPQSASTSSPASTTSITVGTETEATTGLNTTASTSSTTTAARERPTGVNLIGATGAALAAAALVGGVLLLYGRAKQDRPEPEPEHEGKVASPIEGELVPVPEVGKDSAGWQRGPLVLRPAGSLEMLIGVSDGFLAVGQVEGDDSGGRPAVWGARPGGIWNLLSAFDRGTATTAVARGDGILVFGFIEESGESVGCVWEYLDQTWRLLSDPNDSALAGLVFDGAVVHNSVVVAYGRTANSAGGWVSHDGADWERVSLPGSLDLIASVPGALFGFGRDPVARRPVVARSVDGLSWSVLEQDATFVFEGAAIAAVVGFEGGIVAAGTDKMRGAASVWVSDDGHRWLRTPFQAEVGTSIHHLAQVGEGLLAVGIDRGPKRTGRVGTVAVWESNDGVTWNRLHSVDLLSNASVASVATSGGHILIAGKMQAGPGSPWPEPVAVTWQRPATLGGEVVDSTGQLVQS